MEERKGMPKFFSEWESLLSAFLTVVRDLLVSSARQTQIQDTAWILCKVPWTYDLGGPLEWDLILYRTLPPAAHGLLIRGLPTVAERQWFSDSTEWRDAGCSSLYILTLSLCPTASDTICYTLTESPSSEDSYAFLGVHGRKQRSQADAQITFVRSLWSSGFHDGCHWKVKTEISSLCELHSLQKGPSFLPGLRKPSWEAAGHKCCDCDIMVGLWNVENSGVFCLHFRP